MAKKKRKRRSRRRLRTGNSKIIKDDKIIYQGNDTVANRIWARMLKDSGVLSTPRESGRKP